jgi:hypothetical protein|eukprot:SAG25_NODE_244_length_11127_cov_82.802956_6_plen_73_part_00
MAALSARAIVALCCAAGALAQHHHGSNPFEGSNCTCDTFCNEGCNIKTTGAANMSEFCPLLHTPSARARAVI